MFMAMWARRRARLVDPFVTLDVGACCSRDHGRSAEAVDRGASHLALWPAGDYLYQRITWYNRQKMSKQELKEEFKSTEGNPEIKAKLRQLRARGRASG